MRKSILFLGLSAPLALAACGQSFSDRTISGAAIGGATGAVGAAVVGASVGPVLVAGAAAGAVVGAVTDDDDIDLGTPIWKQ